MFETKIRIPVGIESFEKLCQYKGIEYEKNYNYLPGQSRLSKLCNKSAYGTGSFQAAVPGSAVHCSAAVDYLSADIRRHVAGKEQSDFSYIFRSAASSERNLFRPFFTDVLRKGSCHVGQDEARGYAVCSDTSWSHFLCQRFGQSDEPGL